MRFLPLRSFRQLQDALVFNLDSSTSLAQAPAPTSALAHVYTSHPSSVQPRFVALYSLPPPLAARGRLCQRLSGIGIRSPSGHFRLVESQGQSLPEPRRKAFAMTKPEGFNRGSHCGRQISFSSRWIGLLAEARRMGRLSLRIDVVEAGEIYMAGCAFQSSYLPVRSMTSFALIFREILSATSTTTVFRARLGSMRPLTATPVPSSVPAQSMFCVSSILLP